MNKDLYLKRIFYRATYRGGKEADFVLRCYVEKYSTTFNEIDLKDLDHLLQQDDSLIFSWMNDLEKVPENFDTSLFQHLKQYYKALRS